MQLEFLSAAPALDVVYVPIGLGSGICGMLAARDALGLRTEVVGVVSAHATAYAESFAARPRRVAGDDPARRRHGVPGRRAGGAGADARRRRPDGPGDGCRGGGAMALLYECTHNVAEGAGAAAVAAATREAGRIAGRRVGVVLSGANVDRAVFARVLARHAPAPRTVHRGIACTQP
jgi:threonine dehydratase